MSAKKKILVVEDSFLNRSLLCQILADDYDVVEAENGQEALIRLEQYGEQISLILLDIVMPVMDGYTFLSIVKENSAFSSIPVIVTTQSDGEDNEVAALSHGATDFVSKPYKPKVILHRVASLINLVSMQKTAAMVDLFRYDRLTGLYSKEYFYQCMKDTLLQNPDKKYDVICSDIENFKLVNEVFGIPAGDRLLCNIAELYKKNIHGKGLCGRFNADIFVCLLEHKWEYTDDIFAEAYEQVYALQDTKKIVMKWGVYAVADDTLSVEQMCDRARLAAQSIKGQYGKLFAVYDDKLRSKMLKEQAITENMESALADGQFEIYLQPKYRIKDGCLSGAEALVRWNHPIWGLQSPGEFIPLFEKNGFIAKLDQFVWDRACAVLHEWDVNGYDSVPVSVNVSRADIYHADLADTLLQTVAKYNIQPARLHLEITESAYTEDPQQLIDTVGKLRQLGFVVEMDDFGSGYSSLNMLNEMPIDILKLDMKFIKSETAKPTSQGILSFIMNLARWMGLDVVAEGVETREQLERLRAIGCDYAQGYYFSKPMPCKDITQLVKEHKFSEVPAGVQGLCENSPKQQILVVDEDAAYREEVRKTFEKTFQVMETDNEEDALTELLNHKRDIAAVILSMTVAKTSRLGILGLLQKEKENWSIPIIATAPWSELWEEQALQQGAIDFVNKPHSQKALCMRTMHAIHMAQSQRREHIMKEESYHDILTGLLNRRGLDAACDMLRQMDCPLAVYLFDIDQLKLINDTYGYLEGDQLLVQMGKLLRSRVLDRDVVSRLGGDEFIVVQRIASVEDALTRGNELCQEIAKYAHAGDSQVTSSSGLVIWDLHDSLEQVIDHAGQALIQAKKQKRGGCCLWEGNRMPV